MEKPLHPQNESLRLAVLHQSSLSESKENACFDRLTRVAKHVFDVPLAFLSWVDESSLTLASKQGALSLLEYREVSFFGHAILTSDLFEVKNALEDVRLADNPMVVGAPFIRFYAAVSLYSIKGVALGALCIMDIKPRSLTPVEQQTLKELAELAQLEIQRLECPSTYQDSESLQRLSEVIVRAQSHFINQKSRREAFNLLLEDILKVTDSEYGFIGDVVYSEDGAPYLKAYAITDIAWNDATRQIYAQGIIDGVEFRNLDSLFGAALRTKQPVISNHPSQDARSGGLPKGHPDLNSFLGVPIHSGDKMVAMVGMANRAGGYDEDFVAFLNPLMLAIGQIVDASNRQAAQEKIKAELANLSAVASQTTNAVVITDTRGKTVWVNAGFTRLTEYTLEDIRGKSPGELLQGPETDPVTVKKMHAAFIKRQGFEVEVINYSRSGRAYWVRVSCTPLLSESGELEGFIAIQSDIDAKKSKEMMLQESARLQSTILNTMVEGLITTDQDGVIQMCNPAVQGIFGYSQSTLVGKNVKFLMPEHYANTHDKHMHNYKVAKAKHDIMGKARALTGKRANGEIFPLEIAVKETLYNDKLLYVASIRDITALTEQQEKIEKLAYFDPLTQLANRRLLKARIESLCSDRGRKEDCNALLFVDLDDFKNVNDALGHTVGDRLLVEISQRLMSSVLTCHDTVARLGGDEFCVLLSSLGQSQAQAQTKALLVAERIITEIEKPLTIENERLKTSASIGVSFFCGEQVDLSALMKQADIAMYEAKKKGKNQVCVFSSDMEARLLERLTLKSELRTAINENQLTVHYQPVMDQDSNIVKLEALVRWFHPTKGWIRPDIFIPIAEAYQLIVPLGDFVLHRVLQDLVSWRAVSPDLDWKVAVNISQFQLSYEHFYDQAVAAFTEYQLDPSQVIFEVTESAIAQNIDKSIAKMSALKALGITFSLDDFGTGYSSLAYLKQLPISELKIDQSFVKSLPDDLDDVAIVHSILSLAKAMNLRVVAEGVETNQQWAFLKSGHCDNFQGYLFAKPMPANDIEKIIKDPSLLGGNS